MPKTYYPVLDWMICLQRFLNHQVQQCFNKKASCPLCSSTGTSSKQAFEMSASNSWQERQRAISGRCHTGHIPLWLSQSSDSLWSPMKTQIHRNRPTQTFTACQTIMLALHMFCCWNADNDFCLQSSPLICQNQQCKLSERLNYQLRSQLDETNM